MAVTASGLIAIGFLTTSSMDVAAIGASAITDSNKPSHASLLASSRACRDASGPNKAVISLISSMASFIGFWSLMKSSLMPSSVPPNLSTAELISLTESSASLFISKSGNCNSSASSAKTLMERAIFKAAFFALSEKKPKPSLKDSNRSLNPALIGFRTNRLKAMATQFQMKWNAALKGAMRITAASSAARYRPLDRLKNIVSIA